MATKQFQNAKLNVTHLDLKDDASRSVLQSGENISHSLGKIARWYKDIIWTDSKATTEVFGIVKLSDDYKSESTETVPTSKTLNDVVKLIKQTGGWNTTYDFNSNIEGDENLQNGQFKVTEHDLEGDIDHYVSIKGLGSAAFTESSTYATADHTHKYAGSDSVGGAATSANKLNTDAGSDVNPIYFSNGIPVACTYSLNKTVPSNALFTDAKVKQTATTTDADYEILFSSTADNTTRTAGARKNSNLTFNPSTGTLTTTKFVGELSGNATSATTANKLSNTTAIGSSIKPVYFSADGLPVAIDHSIETSVPSNAVFTDTTYTVSSGDNNGQIKVTPSEGDPYNVSVKGLGSAAYTDSDEYATAGHTHKYAGSSSAGGVANSAAKLSDIPTAGIGSETKPVFFSGTTGRPVACTYSLNATVPANAIFTDEKVKQSPVTTDGSFEVLFAGSTGNTAKTEGVGKTTTLTFNPSTGALSATSFTGNGSGLTSLNASNISSGTLSVNRLPGSAVTIGTYGPAAGGTLSHSGTFDVPDFTVDAKGRITGAHTRTFTLPAQYTHPTHTSKASGLYKITVDSLGHVSGTAAVTKSDIPALDYISSTTTRNPNVVLAGPASGTTAAVPTFRALVAADLPSSGATAGSYGPSANATPGYGATFNVPYITIDAKGRVTSIENKTVKIPASDNTNTTYTLSGAYGSSSNTWVTTLTPSSGSATTSTVPTGSTSAYGLMKLYNGVNSTSTALAATANAVKTAYDKANHSHPYVKIRDNGYSYNNLASFYNGSTLKSYIRITVPKGSSTWTMCTLEITLKANYSSGLYGKILFHGNWSSSSDWNNLKAEITHNLGTGIKMYASDKTYIYISGHGSYATCTVDKMTIGDNAVNYDLSAVTIDQVDSLPSTYQTVSMTYYANYSVTGHTHTKSQITDFPSSIKNPKALTVQGNGTTSISYDGSAAKTLNIKPGTGISVSSDTSGNITITNTSTNTDTKNTTGSTNTSSKIFLIGATSQAANPQTYSHDTAYVGTDGCLYSNSTKVSVEGHTHSYLPLAGGTMTGDITFTGVYSTTYPALSNQIYFSGNTDWARILYEVTASDAGQLVFETGDDANAKIVFRNKVTSGGRYTRQVTIADGVISGIGSGLTSLNASNISSGTLSADRLATSGATAGSYGPSANATPGYGATFNVPYITVDAKGRVTAISTKTVKIPASDNTNTTYSFATGDNNGTFKVTPSGGSATNIAIKGLGSAAYTASSAYATAGHTHNYAGSSTAGGPATLIAMARVKQDSKVFPGQNRVKFEEYTAGDSYNLPTNAWYHIISMQGADTRYGTQIAIGMTANKRMYFRNYNESSWQDWTRVSIDGHTHSYLPLAGGTMTGNIEFGAVTSTTYPAESKGIIFSGSTDGASIFYRVAASDQGELVIKTRDDANCIIRMENSTTNAKNTIKFDPYNSYIYANYFNAGCGAETPTTSSYIIYANSDGWLRKSTLANIKTILGLGSAAYTASSAYATSGHTHGLGHSNFTVAIDSTTNTWAAIGVDGTNKYVLKSIRTNTNAPPYLLNDFSAGIVFGGEDTRGVISMKYDTPSIRFAGGNRTAADGGTAKWYITLTGTHNTTYNLDTINHVKQSATSTANFRGVILGTNNTVNTGDTRETTVTGQGYITNKIFAQPSTGNLYASNIYAYVNGTDEVRITLYRSGNSSWRFVNNGGTLSLQNNYYNSAVQSWYNVAQFNSGGTNAIKLMTPPQFTADTNRSVVYGYSSIDMGICSKNSWAMSIKWLNNARDTVRGSFGAYGTADNLSYYYWGTSHNATRLRLYPTDNGGLVTQQANGFRMVNNGYGVIFRTDNTDFYILLTDKKTDGSELTGNNWNGKRPLRINLSSGICDINGSAYSAHRADFLQTAMLYSDASDANSKRYYRVAYATTTDTYKDINALFLITSEYGQEVGIIKVRARTEGTAGTFGSTKEIRWIINSGFTENIVKLVVKNNYNVDTAKTGTATAEVWLDNNTRYKGIKFTILSQGHRTGTTKVWTIKTNTSGGSTAMPTTGVTSTINATNKGISNNAATSTIAKTVYDIDASTLGDTIGIGYIGAGLTTSEALQVACFTSKATTQGGATRHIKDLSFANLKIKIGFDYETLFSGTAAASVGTGAITGYTRLIIFCKNTSNSSYFTVQLQATTGYHYHAMTVSPPPAAQTSNSFYGLLFNVEASKITVSAGKYSNLSSSASLANGPTVHITKVIGYKF